MHVRSARTTPAPGVVTCAVGEVNAAGGRTPPDPSDASDRRVVWIQGGACHRVEHLQWDEHTDRCWLNVPPSAVSHVPCELSDEAALLVRDVAAAIYIAKIVATRRLKTLAIVASSASMCLAHALVHCLHQRPSDVEIHVVLIGDISDAVARSWEAKHPPVTVHHGPPDGGRALLLDCCVDLCGMNASLAFATRQVEPLGTLVLLAVDGLAPDQPVQLDMNAVVVNELSIVNVGDFQHELRDAVEFLTTHIEAFRSIAALLTASDVIKF